MRKVAKASINSSWKSFVVGGKTPSCATCQWCLSDESLNQLMCDAYIYAGETSMVTGLPEQDQKVRCDMVRTGSICKFYAPKNGASNGALKSLTSSVGMLMMAAGLFAAAVAAIGIFF
jgi:hypothetical protein